MAAAYPHRRELMTGPLTVEITAIFSCPESDRRKRVPAPRRPHAKLGDADNIGKAVLDAATGVLWEDDAQVARLLIEKFIGAQDEEPRVELLVREWTP